MAAGEFAYNWDAFSHEAIWKAMQDGRADGFTGNRGGWSELGGQVNLVAGDVQKAIDMVSRSRTGATADATARTVDGLRTWATGVAESTVGVGSFGDRQSVEFSGAKGNMPPPIVPDMYNDWFDRPLSHVPGLNELVVQQDYQDQLRARDLAEAQARRYMARYSESSAAAARTMPAFVVPSPDGPQPGGGAPGDAGATAPDPRGGADGSLLGGVAGGAGVAGGGAAVPGAGPGGVPPGGAPPPGATPGAAPGGRAGGAVGPGPGGAGAGGTGSGSAGAGEPDGSVGVPGGGGPRDPTAVTPAITPPADPGVPGGAVPSAPPAGGAGATPSSGAGAGSGGFLPTPFPGGTGTTSPGTGTRTGGYGTGPGTGSYGGYGGYGGYTGGPGTGGSGAYATGARVGGSPGSLGSDGLLGRATPGAEPGGGARGGLAGGPGGAVESVAARGPLEGARGGGGMMLPPMAGGAGGRGDGDHRRAEFLSEDDPDAIAGTLPPVVPPVIGE